jgi:hypothetical protein
MGEELEGASEDTAVSPIPTQKDLGLSQITKSQNIECASYARLVNVNH